MTVCKLNTHVASCLVGAKLSKHDSVVESCRIVTHENSNCLRACVMACM
jgi:hypothetical protein